MYWAAQEDWAMSEIRTSHEQLSYQWYVNNLNIQRAFVMGVVDVGVN